MSNVSKLYAKEDNRITTEEIDTELRQLFESLKQTEDIEEIKKIRAKTDAIKYILKTQLLKNITDIKKEIVI